MLVHMSHTSDKYVEVSMNWDPLSSGPLVRINLSFLEVYVGGPLLLYSGFTEVLPGPPKYLPHQCPHRARLVPEIVPDPPLHSAQIILALRNKDFVIF